MDLQTDPIAVCRLPCNNNWMTEMPKKSLLSPRYLLSHFSRFRSLGHPYCSADSCLWATIGYEPHDPLRVHLGPLWVHGLSLCCRVSSGVSRNTSSACSAAKQA